MIKDFLLPDLGEGLTESEIVEWHVAEGEPVELDQVLAEVETAKASVELPSPYAGVVERLYAGPGTVVNVGEPIVAFRLEEPADGPDGGTVDDPSDGPSAGRDAGADRDEDPDEDAAPPNLVGYGAAAEARGAPVRRRRRFRDERASEPEPAAAPAPDQALAPEPEQAVAPARPDRSAAEAPAAGLRTSPPVRSTPPVRKLAQRLGVDLSEVTGTGDRGLVTRGDVEGAARPEAEDQPLAGASGGGDDVADERITVRGVRKLTAEAMVASAFTAPHVTVFLTVDATRTVELLARLRERREYREVRLTFLAAVARALCLAVPRHPELNARWAGETGEIVRHRAVHLGVAAATPRGLLVPTLKDVGSAGLARLATEIAELAATARAGRTTPAALRGGTITLSNVGVFGVDAGTPILHEGQAAILAVGALQRRPWEWEGEIALRDVVTLSLSVDHRVVDGEQAALFLADIGRTLTDPATAFAG